MPHSFHRAVVLLAVVAGAVAAESPNPPERTPPCLYFVQPDMPLTRKQIACTYEANLISGQGLFAATFMGAVARLRRDPEEWGQGAKWYGARVGARFTQGLAKTTGEFVAGEVLGQDPRFFPSDRSGTWWQRSGRAFVHTWTTKSTSGKTVFAFSRVAGALSSGFIGQLWYPDRLATPGQGFARSGSAMGGYLASSVFAEFKPDLTALATRLFRGASKPMPAHAAKP